MTQHETPSIPAPASSANREPHTEAEESEAAERAAEARAAEERAAEERAAEERAAEELSDAVLAVSRLFVAISARALASSDETLTLPQLRTLVVLDGHGPVKLAALAATLGVNSSTALRMVERLEALGLVDRRPNPANRREVLLRLTGTGQDLVTRVLTRRRAEIGELVRHLPHENRAALLAALRTLMTAAAETTADPAEATADPAETTAGSAEGTGGDRGILDAL